MILISVKLRSKKNSDGSISLYLDTYIKGTRSYEFLGIKINKNDPERKQKKQIAEAKRSKRELEVISNYHDIPKNFNGDDDFLEFFENNAKDMSAKGAFKNFKSFTANKCINGKLPFKLLSEKLIEDFKEYLQKKFKNSTAWVYLLKLKTILNKAVKEKLIIQSPAKYVRIKLEDIEKVFLTENELKSLAETESNNIEVKKAFLFSCFTGLRISDVKKIIWSQIHEDKLYFKQTKTKGIEYLPLSETALKYLYLNVNKNEIEQDKVVFELRDFETINSYLRKWAKKAGIKKYLTFHSARHTFATMSLNSGIDIYTVSKMLGHKSIKNTEIYAKIVNKTVEEAINKLPRL